MLDWFEQTAPIRVKFRALQIVFVALSGLGLLATVLAGIAGSTPAIVLAVVAMLGTVMVGALAFRLIRAPVEGLVAAVEALAVGDMAAPIPYTDHADCTGRIARAMTAWRDSHLTTSQAREARQRQFAQSLSAALRAMADGQLDCTITEEFPENFAAVRDDFNHAVETLSATIGAVRASAGSVLTAAAEIRAAADDLGKL